MIGRMRPSTPIYAHEDASIPSSWVDVSSEQYGDVWMRNEVAVRKSDQIFVVSREFLEDYGPEGVFGILRPTPWAERAERELYRFRLGYRIRSWLRDRSTTIRRSIAERIYPERDFDY